MSLLKDVNDAMVKASFDSTDTMVWTRAAVAETLSRLEDFWIDGKWVLNEEAGIGDFLAYIRNKELGNPTGQDDTEGWPKRWEPAP